MIYGVEPRGYWDDEPEDVTAAREAEALRAYQEEIGQEMAWDRELELGMDDVEAA